MINILSFSFSVVVVVVANDFVMIGMKQTNESVFDFLVRSRGFLPINFISLLKPKSNRT